MAGLDPRIGDPVCDPRVDAYIARQAEFAQPILQRIRVIVHEACPQVEETIKWGMPSFVYAGGILCGMAAFKQHASFGFWKHALVIGDGTQPAPTRDGTLKDGTPRDGMGSFGKMTSLKDLPPKKDLAAYISKAMALNERGTKAAGGRKTTRPKPPPEVPSDLAAALQENRKAKVTFDAFSPSHQREYVEWITGAKREQTRHKRLLQTLQWLAEGKPRNWKYMDC